VYSVKIKQADNQIIIDARAYRFVLSLEHNRARLAVPGSGWVYDVDTKG